MIIHVHQEQHLLPIDLNSVKTVVATFNKIAEVSYDEVSIYFIDTQTICELHQQYFDDPSPTDCISFPMDDPEEEGYKVMGDVFVCPETAQKYIQEHGGDAYQELTLYVIHGLLHLLGYDDIDEEDRQTMRQAESHYMSALCESKSLIKPAKLD